MASPDESAAARAGGSSSTSSATSTDGERKYRTLVEHLNIGVFLTTLDGKLLHANAAVIRMAGYETLEEFMQRPAQSLYANPEDRKRFVELLARDGEVRSFETTSVRKDGSRYPIRLGAVLLRDAQGAPELLLGTTEDISEKERAEREREALQSQLVQAQKMESIGRLAGGVAHDFNNMLSVILGHADLALSELTPSDKLYRDIEQIRSAAERSAALAGQLLAFARRQTTEPKVLDLNRATDSMLELLRRLIGEQIQLEFRPGSPLWQVKIDPVQLQQILTNLCLNARDAVDGVGTISIETESVSSRAPSADGARPGLLGADCVRLSVKDTGKGVAEELKERLFEPFFTTKPAGRGTGLGLATVWGIVHQNDGSIEVQSTPGQGSTFSVYLPKYVGQPSSASLTLATHQRGAGQRLLLVEDEEAILDVEQRILERLGYQVLRAATPQEALRLAESQSGAIDLLLTDVIMPEMNGRELAGRLASICPGLPTLYLSGYPADVIANHGVLEPGVHFLQKPFTVQAISEKVSEMLALRAIPRTL